MIALTESEDEGVRCLAQGANDYHAKPYQRALLRHCLRSRIAARNLTVRGIQAEARERKTAGLLQTVLDSVVSGISAAVVQEHRVNTLFINENFMTFLAIP